jgi:multisubunit Na+/H+ antiporter MnhB subunit
MKRDTYTIVIAIFIGIFVMLLLPLMGGDGPRTATPDMTIESSSTRIGQDVSAFMWRYRGLDLVAQAFLLCAAAASCITMLRSDEEKE